MGQIIMLNGTSSAGKTTLSRAIQEAAEEPFLYTGLDACFAMVPDKWGGGRGGPLSRNGFRYVDGVDDHGRPDTTIEYGPEGDRMLRAFRAGTAALAASGMNLVIDELLLDGAVLAGWAEVLDPAATFLVGVHCSIDVLVARERARAQRPGLARGFLPTVHSHTGYDLEVDTTGASMPDLAAEVLRHCRTHAPTALDRYRRR